MYSTFAELLEKKKVSVYEVSKETGIAQSTLSDWKNGRYIPKADKLLKIAKYFGVPIETFIKTE